MVTITNCAFKEIRLYFPLAYSIGEFIETVKAFEQGSIRPELMVSDVIGLYELPAMFERMRAGVKTLKVHVDPTMEPSHA